MKDVLAFFSEHWFLGFLALCFIYGLLVRILRMPMLLIRGWPPEYFDADGDYKREDKDKPNG